MSYLKPNAYYTSLVEADVEQWKQKGFRLVVLDLDNTLILHGGSQSDDYSRQQIERIHQAGLDCLILSNARTQRVQNLAQNFQVDLLADAGKPGTKKLQDYLERKDYKVEEVLLVGDQLFTDILCAKRLGLYSVLVDPRGDREPWYIKFKRLFEKIPKQALIKNKILNQ